MDLAGNVAIITGSTGELGTAVTQAFLRANATVVGLGSRESTIEQLRSSLGHQASFTGLVTNVLDETSMERMVEKVIESKKRIDILVNVAGGFVAGGSVAETSAEQWDQMMALNARSVFLCCKHVFPTMLKQNRGQIVNIGGKGGLRAVAGLSAYSASKAAVINLTQCLAAEGREQNVTANVVVPSIIDTAANRAGMPNADFGKWVTPEAVAEVILFLCSERARDISGAIVPVYGKS